MKKLAIGLALLFVMAGIPALAGAAEKDSKTVTLEGQLVCSSCWFEEDRKEKPYGGEADIKCAIRCAKKNIKQALAVVGETETTLYLLEPGRLKNGKSNWLNFVGKQVTITGTTRIEGDKHFLKVDSLQPVKSEDHKSAAKKAKD
jgi:hypothetical protein